MIEFTQAIKLFYSNFVNFDGRSTRAEYWWVQLYMALVIFSFAVFIGVSLGSAEGLESGDYTSYPSSLVHRRSHPAGTSVANSKVSRFEPIGLVSACVRFARHDSSSGNNNRDWSACLVLFSRDRRL